MFGSALLYDNTGFLTPLLHDITWPCGRRKYSSRFSYFMFWQFCFQMPPPTVLRKRHSLVGKDLIPLAKKFKNVADAPSQYARLKMNLTLESMEESELQRKYREITGGSEKDMFELADRSYDEENFRRLLHLTICYANEVGHPVGQELVSIHNRLAV